MNNSLRTLVVACLFAHAGSYAMIKIDQSIQNNLRDTFRSSTFTTRLENIERALNESSQEIIEDLLRDECARVSIADNYGNYGATFCKHLTDWGLSKLIEYIQGATGKYSEPKYTHLVDTWNHTLRFLNREQKRRKEDETHKEKPTYISAYSPLHVNHIFDQLKKVGVTSYSGCDIAQETYERCRILTTPFEDIMSDICIVDGVDEMLPFVSRLDEMIAKLETNNVNDEQLKKDLIYHWQYTRKTLWDVLSKTYPQEVANSMQSNTDFTQSPAFHGCDATTQRLINSLNPAITEATIKILQLLPQEDAQLFVKAEEHRLTPLEEKNGVRAFKFVLDHTPDSRINTIAQLMSFTSPIMVGEEQTPLYHTALEIIREDAHDRKKQDAVIGDLNSFLKDITERCEEELHTDEEILRKALATRKGSERFAKEVTTNRNTFTPYVEKLNAHAQALPDCARKTFVFNVADNLTMALDPRAFLLNKKTEEQLKTL